MQGGRAKREIKEELQCRPLGCPLARRCPSGRIEEESLYVVVEAAAWPGRAVHFGTLGASPELERESGTRAQAQSRRLCVDLCSWSSRWVRVSASAGCSL
jgi:hypothetical protein